MKIARLLLPVVGVIVLAGCDNPGPALSVSKIQIVAPAPGRSATVAYLTITNDGETAHLTGVSSPDFASAELHETSIKDGIARMQPVGELEIGAHASVELKPGGLHIMLLDPSSAPLPGKSVTLRLEFDSGDMLVVDAPLATRVDVD